MKKSEEDKAVFANWGQGKRENVANSKGHDDVFTLRVYNLVSNTGKLFLLSASKIRNSITPKTFKI